MPDSAQTMADRRRLYRTSLEMRMGGLAVTTLAAIDMVQSVPAEKFETVLRGSVVAAGVYLMTKVARDFYRAAHAPHNPMREARRLFNQVRGIPLFTSTAIAGMFCVSALNASAEIRKSTGVTSTEVRMEKRKPEIVREKNPDCPHGNATITFDDKNNRATIMECSGPLTFRQGG